MDLPPQNGVADTASEVTEEATEEVSLDSSTVASQQNDEIFVEISQLEYEIKTLREALERKENRLAALKKQLGITRWTQLRQGIGEKYQAVQNSEMYNKLSHGASTTKDAIGEAGGKASAALKNFGSATAKKWTEIRESPRFQSMEEKLWATTSAVKAKIGGQKEQAAVTDTKVEPEKTEPSAL